MISYAMFDELSYFVLRVRCSTEFSRKMDLRNFGSSQEILQVSNLVRNLYYSMMTTQGSYNLMTNVLYTIGKFPGYAFLNPV